MILNHILFQFFRSQAESDQGCEGGGVAEDAGQQGGEGVGGISVKIKLTALCLHLTLFNEVQVVVHVDFFTFLLMEQISVHVHISSSNSIKNLIHFWYSCTMNECFTDTIS